MRLVLLGPPGAGKGTQAAAVRDRLGVPHVSTGDMLRQAIDRSTPLGLKAKAIVEAGGLVPDEVMAELVAERLGQPDAARGFLLDGYPRTLRQAEDLGVILGRLGVGLDHVLYLSADDREIIRRLSGRRTCASCGALYHLLSAAPRSAGRCDVCAGELTQRADDREEVVAQRMKVYRERTEPLVDHYKRAGLLRAIDAQGDVAQVTERVLAGLREPAPTEGRRS